MTHHRLEDDGLVSSKRRHRQSLLSIFSSDYKKIKKRSSGASMMYSYRPIVIALLSAATLGCAQEEMPGLFGDDSCRCLTLGELINEGTTTLVDTDKLLGNNIDITTYGVGCDVHDEYSNECVYADECTNEAPLPEDCEKSYCKRPWCYVGPDCSLNNDVSGVFRGRHYSYATCGDLDRFVYTERLKSLEGKIFNVGFMSNSGGWKGSYNPEGTFAINDKWYGPTVDFIGAAAEEGRFTINITKPPDWLFPYSQEFFGNGSFDFCAYAVSLGYLDFCVGAFTITEKRSSITTMFETMADPLYLVVHNQLPSSGLEKFARATVTVFQPFSAGSWATIFLFVLPSLGLLMFYHEYGQPGSSFPKVEPILVHKKRNEEAQVARRPIPRKKHLLSAFYTGMLSFFTGSTGLSVVTAGGKLNLLAASSFVMLILTVYTANLAAMLTANHLKLEVNSLEVAIKEEYNFCMERKIADFVTVAYGLDPTRIVNDPPEVGGDGKPGFMANNPREMVLARMSRSAEKNDQKYCKAAIVDLEDLQKMHSFGRHCDKTHVGDNLGYRINGIPIFDKHSPSLLALLYKVKGKGAISNLLRMAKPKDICPVQDDESALNPQQLTGVWVVTFGFALVGLLVKWVKEYKGERDNAVVSKQKLRRYDQWLNPPAYDVIVSGYRYDGENNTIIRLDQAGVDSDGDGEGVLQHHEESDADSSTGELSSRSAEAAGDDYTTDTVGLLGKLT